MMNEGLKRSMISEAMEAMEYAYAPISAFKVGACILAKSGKTYTGCNIENASIGATCCAERTALYKAVSEGERAFSAIAVAVGDSPLAFPCGICRQALYEFDADSGSMLIITANARGESMETTLSELYPHPFGPGNLD